MNSLILNPEATAVRTAERSLAMPATLDTAASGVRQNLAARNARRRFQSSWPRAYDSGFRPFRVY